MDYKNNKELIIEDCRRFLNEKWLIKDNNKKLALEVRAAKAAPVFDQSTEKQPEVPAFGEPAPIPSQNNPDLFSF